jgi:hypothetical protein
VLSFVLSCALFVLPALFRCVLFCFIMFAVCSFVLLRCVLRVRCVPVARGGVCGACESIKPRGLPLGSSCFTRGLLSSRFAVIQA